MSRTDPKLSQPLIGVRAHLKIPRRGPTPFGGDGREIIATAPASVRPRGSPKVRQRSRYSLPDTARASSEPPRAASVSPWRSRTRASSAVGSWLIESGRSPERKPARNAIGDASGRGTIDAAAARSVVCGGVGGARRACSMLPAPPPRFPSRRRIAETAQFFSASLAVFVADHPAPIPPTQVAAMTEVNTTTSSPLLGAIGKIKESALHVFSQVRPPSSSSLLLGTGPRGVVSRWPCEPSHQTPEFSQFAAD